MLVERCQFGSDMRVSNGEAGTGVYAYLPSNPMRTYYSRSGEEVYHLVIDSARVVDLTTGDNVGDLLKFAKARFKQNAKTIPGYVIPVVDSHAVQRYGSLVEDYVRQKHPGAGAWIVYHQGQGIPSGKQVVISDQAAIQSIHQRPAPDCIELDADTAWAEVVIADAQKVIATLPAQKILRTPRDLDSFLTDLSSHFEALTWTRSPLGAKFFVDALHGQVGGEHANRVADFAFRFIDSGFDHRGDDGRLSTLCFSAHCVHTDNIELLREVALRGAPARLPQEMQPQSRAQWLDLLCTTRSIRNHPAFGGMDTENGIVGTACDLRNVNHKACEALLELVLEIDPEHEGFMEMLEDSSEDGAFVRAFFTRRSIAAAHANALAQAGAVSTADPTRSASTRHRDL